MDIPPDYMLFFLIVIVFAAAFIILPIPNWIMAKRFGAKITFIEAMMMSFRMVKARKILNALSMAASIDIDITAEELERHYVNGGSPQKVVMFLVKAKNRDVFVYKNDVFEADFKNTLPELEKTYFNVQ